MTHHCGDDIPTIKLGYGPEEAAAIIGIDRTYIYDAVRNGDLVMRRFGDSGGTIAHYDLELWLLGQPDYMATKDAVEAKQQAENDRVEANRQAKAQERREAKAARAAIKAAQAEEDARIASDLAELERLRALASK